MSAAMLLFVAACDDDNSPTPIPPSEDGQVTAITLEPASAELIQGETLQLKASFTPADATNIKDAKWSVGNPDIASVSESGIVTAKQVGKTTVICKAGKVEASCAITVKEKPVEENLVTSITLEPSSAELIQGETLQLKASFTPADATNISDIEWTVRHPNIASVSNEGLVTAKEVGDTEIICKVGKAEAVCTLKVTEKQMEKADFEVNVVEIGATQVRFNIIPKDKNAPYFCDVIPVSTLNCENIGGIKNIAKKDREWWEMVTGSKDPAAWIKAFGYKGDLQYDSQSNENGSGIKCMFWGMDYMLYIYGLDENAMPSTKILEVPFKTAHHRDSENKISVEVIKTFAENIHAKITTTNDDPWFFLIESKKFWDKRMTDPYYPELGPEESFANDMLIRNFDIPFLFKKGNLEITPETQIVPPTLRPDREYVLVVFGFDPAKGSTTKIIVTPFKTQPKF